jgi:hypothetical protein
MCGLEATILRPTGAQAVSRRAVCCVVLQYNTMYVKRIYGLGLTHDTKSFAGVIHQQAVVICFDFLIYAVTNGEAVETFCFEVMHICCC